MQGSKIRLSPAEVALFSNAEMILTKNSILQKTVALLAQVQETISENNKAYNFTSTPKISRGENYLGLPYVILDYPRISNGNDLFFIRSMFWWGNFFSSTLHIAGTYKEKNLTSLASAYDELLMKEFSIGVNSDPWQHHFEETNYKDISQLSKEEFMKLLINQLHIKIAARWPLSEWDAAATLLAERWKFLTGLIA